MGYRSWLSESAGITSGLHRNSAHGKLWIIIMMCFYLRKQILWFDVNKKWNWAQNYCDLHCLSVLLMLDWLVQLFNFFLQSLIIGRTLLSLGIFFLWFFFIPLPPPPLLFLFIYRNVLQFKKRFKKEVVSCTQYSFINTVRWQSQFFWWH